MAARLGAALRASASEFAGRFWMMTRVGCCLAVFNDYIAEFTVVRVRCGVCTIPAAAQLRD